MKNLLFKKTLSGLVPYDGRTQSYVEKIGLDRVVTCEMKQPRNYEFHKKFFAMLDIVYSNLPHELENKFKNQDELLTELKLQTGWRDKFTTLGGREFWLPKSISFSSMDHQEFDKFYNRCLDVVQKHIIPMIDKEELKKAINEF